MYTEGKAFLDGDIIVVYLNKYNKTLLNILCELALQYGVGEQSLYCWQFRKNAADVLYSKLSGWLDTTRLGSLLSGTTNIPCPPGLAYYSYQIDGVLRMAKAERSLLADDTGTGKTIQICGLINLTKPGLVVLVVPAIAKLNWYYELKKWVVDDYPIVFGNTKTEFPDRGIVIITLASLKQHGVFKQGRDALGRVRRQAVLGETLPDEVDLLVLDEAHILSNPKSRQSKFFFELAKRAKRAVLVTGTPIRNRNYDVWPIAHFVWPNVFNNWRYFCMRYCGAGYNLYGYFDYSNSINTDELRKKLLSAGMIRRTKAEVIKDLPPLVWKVTRLEAGRNQTNLIKTELKLEEELRGLADKTGSTRRDIILSQIAEIRRELGLAKVEIYSECIVSESFNDKIIVFAHHRDVIDSLITAFGNIAVMLRGDMTATQRQDAIDKFQNDNSCRIIVASIKAAGVAINLTKAGHIIFIELDWVPADIEQAIARAHRIGQMHDSLLVEFIVFENSFDCVMAEKLSSKSENIKKLLG